MADAPNSRPDPTEPTESAPRRHVISSPWSRRAIIALAVFVGVIVLGGFADFATSSPQLCGSCHAMSAKAETWSASAHAAVKCISCHERPHPWYAVPQALATRTGLLVRDAYWAVAGRSEEATPAAGEHTDLVADENCLQCHDPNRPATSGFRILIDHAEHAQRNGSCISCHINTAHPEPLRGEPLSLMAECFACHGTAEQPEASAECGACHPSDYELFPASHEGDAWEGDHGGVSRADPRQCEMCHEASYCQDCHVLEMPHPTGWDAGPDSHAVYAEEDREVCANCHREEPDLCSMCHHEAYDPTRGDWVDQHQIQVRDEGTVFCMGCHAPLFCVECHTGGAETPAGSS